MKKQSIINKHVRQSKNKFFDVFSIKSNKGQAKKPATEANPSEGSSQSLSRWLLHKEKLIS
jgi:hypothetical protein